MTDPARGPRGFEDWLRECPLPHPRGAFRKELRASFVGSHGRTSDSASRDPAGDRTEHVSDLETFLRQRAAPPDARAAFRAELRERFLAGRWSEGAEARPRTGRTPHRHPRLFPALAGLAGLAAAALLAILLPRLGRPTTPWRVVGVEEATVVSAGPGGAQRVAARDGTIDLSGLLEGPDGIAVAAGSLRLCHGDEYRLEVRPGTRLVLAPEGGLALELRSGEIFLQTFPAYGGTGLDVDTPEAHVSVHGTTLGVRADAMGTCVCVVEGTVKLRELERAQDVVVPQASSHLVSADASMMSKSMHFPEGQAAPGDAEHEHVDRLREFAETDWR